MRQTGLVCALWLTAAMGTLATVLAAKADFRSDARPAAVGTAVGGASNSRTAGHANADSLARMVASGDLFRVDRRPSATAFDPNRPGDWNGAPSRVLRPQLVLRGLMLGDTARALIEGFPETEVARLVHVGEIVASLRILSISASAVRVASPDTTWTLTLRRANP
jgi:hypothetical protein